MSSGMETRRVRIGWLIDGRGGQVRRQVAMEVADGRILSVGPDADPEAGGLDLSQATVLPGLIDTHVHLAFSGTVNAAARNAQRNWSAEEIRGAIARHLHDHWRCGVVAVRDGGDRTGVVRQCRGMHRFSTNAPPVAVHSPGWAWHAPGCYGAMIGRHPPEGTALPDAVAPQLFDVDHLKLILSDINSLKRLGPRGQPQFGHEALSGAVRVAHKAGKPVMAHANGAVAVGMALACGCDSIEHGYFMGRENLRRMADLGSTWVPTAIPMAVLVQADRLDRKQRDIARRTLDLQLEQIRRAHEMGVAIALGTDAGGFGVHHGHAVRLELGLLMTAGLSLAAAIRCATSNAARLMGLSDLGALVPGRRAVFLAASGPPEHLPGSLGLITARCYDGTFIGDLPQLPDGGGGHASR